MTAVAVLPRAVSVVERGRAVRRRSAEVANDLIRAAVRADASDRLPFECECGLAGCRERVWITLAEFDSQRDRRDPIHA